MITSVSGSFRNFKAEVEANETDFSTAQINLTAEMESISTNNEQRDAHLRNTDFFEVEKYPELKFKSTKVTKTGSDTFDLNGELTLKGITKPVKLHVEYNGIAKDPWGGERAGFAITGKINRSDWGVNFNGVLETGSVMLSRRSKNYRRNTTGETSCKCSCLMAVNEVTIHNKKIRYGNKKKIDKNRTPKVNPVFWVPVIQLVP